MVQTIILGCFHIAIILGGFGCYGHHETKLAKEVSQEEISVIARVRSNTYGTYNFSVWLTNESAFGAQDYTYSYLLDSDERIVAASGQEFKHNDKNNRYELSLNNGVMENLDVSYQRNGEKLATFIFDISDFNLAAEPGLPDVPVTIFPPLANENKSPGTDDFIELAKDRVNPSIVFYAQTDECEYARDTLAAGGLSGGDTRFVVSPEITGTCLDALPEKITATVSTRNWVDGKVEGLKGIVVQNMTRTIPIALPTSRKP